MEKIIYKKQNIYVSEEEKTLIGRKFKIHLKRHLEMKYIIVGYKKYH